MTIEQERSTSSEVNIPHAPQEIIYDFAVVGAGPAGLHAAYKSALLGCRVVIFNRCRRFSRVHFVPRLDNIPTRPGGISGRELLKFGEEMLAEYPDLVAIHQNELVTSITVDSESAFRLRATPTLNCKPIDAGNPEGVGYTSFRARAVVLATGVVDRQPIINGSHRPVLPYANAGIVHYCTICDGHYLPGKSVGVLGADEHAAMVALSLLEMGSERVEMFTNEEPLFGEILTRDQERLAHHIGHNGVKIHTDPIKGFFGIEQSSFGVETTSGKHHFDKGWVALGWYTTNIELGLMLGAKIDNECFIATDMNCQVIDETDNPIRGLYAIGDIRDTWNQIPIAWGNAEKAIIHAWAEYL